MLAIVRAMAPGVLAYASPPSKDTKGDHGAFIAWLSATRPEGRDWRDAWTRFQKERGPAEQSQTAPPAKLPEVSTPTIEAAVVAAPAPLPIRTPIEAQPDPEPAATAPVRTFLIAIPVLV